MLFEDHLFYFPFFHFFRRLHSGSIKHGTEDFQVHVEHRYFVHFPVFCGFIDMVDILCVFFFRFQFMERVWNLLWTAISIRKSAWKNENAAFWLHEKLQNPKNDPRPTDCSFQRLFFSHRKQKSDSSSIMEKTWKMNMLHFGCMKKEKWKAFLIMHLPLKHPILNFENLRFFDFFGFFWLFWHPPHKWKFQACLLGACTHPKPFFQKFLKISKKNRMQLIPLLSSKGA